MKFLALSGVVAGVAAVSSKTWMSMDLETEESKNRPVSKVIALLKGMQKTLEEETESDGAMYEKLSCWCEKNDKLKTKAIADAESSIDSLTSKIEEKTGLSAQLTTEIANLEKEVANNQKALDEATAMRKKQLEEFNAEEKDLIQSIGSLKSAVTVLKKHQSFLQTGASLRSAAKAADKDMPMVASMLSRTMSRLSDKLSPKDQETVTAFMAQAQAPSAGSYSSGSGEIFGILTQMLETFEEDLKGSRDEEATNLKNFEELKSAKEEQIGSGKELLSKKTQELADSDEILAQSKTELKQTEETLAADQEFLANLKEKCSQIDKEFEERQATRAQEIMAVGKALEFLSSDEAHDLFSRTFNFIQLSTSTHTMSASRAKAAAVLRAAAQKAHNPRLSAMATRVKLDAFTKVKAAIDAMVEDLKKEQADEVAKKDYCTSEFNANEKETSDATRKSEQLSAKKADLESKIEMLVNDLKTANESIASNQTELKKAGEDRELENKNFQTMVADQKATIQLLTKALDVLESFYAKPVPATALMQQTPPGEFGSRDGASAQSGGVLGMIKEIINDAKLAMTEATTAEQDAQVAYETFVKDTN